MIRKTILAALVLLAGCSGEQPKDPGKSEGYALTMAVTPAQSGSLQRVALPPAAILALQRGDAGDVRIFDATGKVISLARQSANGSEFSVTRVPTYPIAGAAAAPGASAVTVKIDQASQNVSVETLGAEAEAAAHSSAAVLFDTRELADRVTSITFDADLPPNQPVEVTLEASYDLKNWESLGSKVLFRGEAGKAVLDSTSIALEGAVLKGRYLRASWPISPGIAIRGGSIFTTKELPAAPIAIPAQGAKLVAERDLRLTLPKGYSPKRLRISNPQAGGVVPVQLYTRESSEQPWIGLSAATLRGDKPADLDLSRAGLTEYRIEADQRSAGFAAAPKIELLYDQVMLIAAFNSKGPFTLAVGNKAAPPAYFVPGELLGETLVSAVPSATVAAPTAPPSVQLAGVGSDSPFTPKTLALWAALLAAVGVLVFAAVRLMKAPANPPAD